MPRYRAAYPPEFRRQMIDLVRAGRSPQELSREFEPNAETIKTWVKQAERDESVRPEGLATGEREELNRLRRENKQLRLEREILSKAAAWFANEILGTPKRSSIDPHQGVRFIHS